jgi:hypothetical protein
LDYDYVKTDSYSFNVQTNYHRNRDTGEEFALHAELRIILR